MDQSLLRAAVLRRCLVKPESTAASVLGAAALELEMLEDQLRLLAAAHTAACPRGGLAVELHGERAGHRPRGPAGGGRVRVQVVLEA